MVLYVLCNFIALLYAARYIRTSYAIRNKSKIKKLISMGNEAINILLSSFPNEWMNKWMNSKA